MNNLVTVFKALSDETRLRVLRLLQGGELCVCDIVAALDMIQPKVSFHLGVLKEAGLIRDRKQGRWTHYRLDDSDMFKRFLLLSVFENFREETVTKDEQKLKAFLEAKEGKARVVDMKNCACKRRG